MITHPLVALTMLSPTDRTRRRGDATPSTRRTGRARRRRSPREN
jgi:hypothetical protein